ncbi:MAG TPA: PilZ domain-containing protein [Candidatus Stercorousia faecigallinarum]|nr:PilZ domain-containing protein [Candidatus Stercorousia faecigallinarum]
MRELIEKDRKITVVPSDFKCANKGTIVDVEPRYFTIELEYEPDGIMRHNYCEFYTQTNHGTLYFDSYPETIEGKRVKIANPAKHRFLQRRQYTRIKFVHELDLTADNIAHKITTLDISAGGMKIKTNENINIEGNYKIVLPLSEEQFVECVFSPIRIEKNENGGYTISGRFEYHNNKDKMTLTQYCTKRSIEIQNK